MKLDYLTITSAVAITIILLGVLMLAKNPNPNEEISTPSSYEYFWSDTCTDCKKVEDFLDSSLHKNSQIEKYQINDSNINRQRFVQRAKDCQIPRNLWAIPFLVSPRGICLRGYEAIIQHLKEVKFQ